MSVDDKDAWRRLVGQDEEPEETPEEARAREERIASGNPLVRDVFAELPAIMERKRRENLARHGLNDAYTDDEKQIVESTFELMSEEQKEQYLRASKAYGKRGFRRTDPDDPTNGLMSFAATNPPEVLRKHVWRLQRGLDQPMFGAKPTEKPNRVRGYTAKVLVSICDRCAEELERETEQAGARPSDNRKYGRFYDRSDAGHGYYLFRYGEMYVGREHPSLGGFPVEEPKECARCGADDVALWRERFGEKDDGEERG